MHFVNAAGGILRCHRRVGRFTVRGIPSNEVTTAVLMNR